MNASVEGWTTPAYHHARRLGWRDPKAFRSCGAASAYVRVYVAILDESRLPSDDPFSDNHSAANQRYFWRLCPDGSELAWIEDDEVI